jgi:hypothetical protein
MSVSFWELQADLFDLYLLGLDQEEVDGYICFYWETYQPEIIGEC